VLKGILKGILGVFKRGEKKKKGVVREIIEAVAIAIVLALFIRCFVVQAFKIPSSSMEDTLLIGDHLLVKKYAYGLQRPKATILGWTVFKVGGVPVFALPVMDSEMLPYWGNIERGDIIVFRPPTDRTKDFIKRVIALGGDTVELKANVVYVNDKPVNEPYVVFKPVPLADDGNFAKFNVPEGSVFVMGDNRNNSSDSRVWGPVRISEIKGKAWRIYWSKDPVGGDVRFSRFGSAIE